MTLDIRLLPSIDGMPTLIHVGIQPMYAYMDTWVHPVYAHKCNMHAGTSKRV
jgi:hypothetical protein